MQLPLVGVEWFMCLFVNTLRPEVVFRVWDVFFNEGSKTLFRIAMAMLKRSESVLLKCDDPGQFFLAVKNIGKDIVNPDELIGLAYKTFHVPDRSAVTSPLPTGTPRRHRSIRYAAPTKAKSVPRDLVGIGLAHLGPKSLYSNVSQIADDEPDSVPQNYLTEVVVGHKYGSASSRRIVQERSSNPYAPSDFEDLDMARNSFLQSLEGDVGSMYRNQTKSRHKPRRKKDVYRNFGVFEIMTWRNQFHPEVQARILSMEKVRNEYKRQRQTLEETSASAAAKGAVDSLAPSSEDTKVTIMDVNQSMKCGEAPVASTGASSVSDGDPEKLRSQGSVDESEQDFGSCANDEYVIEGGDDDDEAAVQRLDSIAKSPDIKMHDASPQLWQMLFEDRGAQEE
jgi:hypothetical protein